MGRSKFPGKPSKLVNKKRVSVLQGSENSLVNENSEGYVDYLPNDQISLWNRRNETSTFGHGGCVQSVPVPQAREKPPSSEPPDGGGRRFQSVVKIDKPFNAGVTTRARSITPITVCSIINKSDCTNKNEKSQDKTVKKKTVTFKNSLETSDDASAVKKVYNPDNAPLVPIIKKECLSRSVRLARSDCIVRPSRLTEIIKSNANNIDKLNFLTFKSSPSPKMETNVPCVSLQSSENTESSVNRQKEEISRNKAVVVGDKRFVLPKRSAHSCRVIKPNKRFQDNVNFSVQNIRKTNATCRKKSGKNQPRYEESTSNYNCQQQNCVGNTQQESFINNSLSFQINSSKLNEDDISEVDDEIFKISHQVTDDTQSDFSDDDTGNALRILCRNNPSNSPSTSFFGAFAGSKFILRQPRLQFDLQTKLSSSVSNTKSMFTATNRCDDNAPENLVNTNYCGVCGTTCKTLQQSQKFGIFSCEACRKFILKSIKKLAASPENSELNALQCVRGDGTCIISPFFRGSMNKNLKKTFKERCHACWLKKCVTSYHVSTGLRNRLLAKLPASFIESEKSITQLNIKKESNTSTEITNMLSNSLFCNPSTKLINWAENIDTALLPSNTLAENNATFGSSPLIRNKIIEKRVFSINSIECSRSNLLNEKKMLNPVTCSKLVCDEEINKNKFRPKDRENSTAQQLAIDAPKRQRIDLKGPRVKHVCRSASIVLGHPIATFPNDITALETMDMPPRPYSPSCVGVELSQSVLSEEQSVNCTNCDSKKPNLGLSPPATPTQGNTLEICENYNKTENGSKPFTRKISRPLLSKKVLREKCQANSSPAISIDFWENYDPAEVSQTGFGLILTESIAIRALCFLCGSAGLDLMIYCSCCCEPYHQYCVEDEYNLKHSALDETMTSILDLSLNIGSNLNLITNRLNWLCPRCTVCYTCNMSSGSKVKCQKCQKNYHTTCLGTSKRLLGADRPLICASCLKCKSCATTKVTKFVGNLPMCSQCFKLRKRGNYCPTCQKCYEDNDFDLKMMECGDCQRWVHAKCEGLSDEQYNLLSTLPESIEFICKKCSNTNAQSNLWRQAVASEFKSGLLSVVKLLSKSRQAYALLKLSPRKKSMTCICAPIQTSRSLNFNSILSDTKSTDEESQNSELSALEDVYIFKEVAQINKCFCNSNQKLQSNVPSLVDIKSKINSGEYVSLAEFNYDMSNVISAANCDELIIVYKEILSETFPWFQNETKACTDLLEEDMFDSNNFTQTSEVECDQQVPVIDLPENLHDYFYPPSKKEDIRPCMFCKEIGERITIQESRLLYCGHNLWVHINCAMWSAEVFEEIDGSLQNVHSAISRGRLIKCTHCGNRGATVGCNIKSCGEHYHYPCARKSHCAFLTDKTVYCPQHQNELTKKKCVNIEKNFEVKRPVYVELDRKRKKMVDPSKVQFLIGSLEVKNIGNIFSKLSDSNEALIPVDFQCTRLYWSIKEPWKIVEYTVKTSIESNVFTFSTDCGRHFTVDHANSSSIVQLGLAQIGRWHNSLLLGEDNDILLRQERSVKQLLEVVGQNYNTDDATEEEPQNNADLLPPEIKDAIFEDLPHELLDGISMLDIFPKLMIYEDMIAVDSKAEGFYTSEYTKDCITSEEDGNDFSHKELDMSNSWPMSSGISHVEDAMLSATRSITSNREIKRSKSEIFQRSIGNSRSQQRASSLTYSCKIDSASTKRRKISKGHPDIRISESLLLSIGRRKEDLPVLDRCRSSQNEDIKTKTFSWSAAKKYSQTEMKTIHEKNVIPRDFIDKLKISQLDGMDDLVSDNDFKDFSQMRNVHDKIMSECPVKCDRCNCTYRTRDSYQRHLTNCELLSTSESESETARSPPLATHNIVLTTDITNINKNVQPSISIVQNINQSSLNTMNAIPITSHSTTNTIPISCSMQNIQFQNLHNNSIPITQLNQGLSNIFITNSQQNSHHQYFPLQTINGTHLLQPKSDIPTVSVSTNVLQQQQPQIFTMSTPNGNQQVVAITPQQSIISQSSRSTNSAMCQKPQIYRSQNEKGAPKIKSLQRIHQSPTTKLKSKMGHASKPILMKKTFQRPEGRTISIVNQNIPTPGLVLQHNTNTQPIIVQQVNNNPNNIVSYVTDGHNQQMQYVTVPSANDFKQPQTPFLTTNPLVQGAFLQTDSSGNLVLTNGTSGLQMLSAPLQISQQSQPQVIGTLLQPQTGALQCGVMSAEQMVLGPGPTIEMVTNPTMLLASQPVYYGLETIVQNTVMSSQQFVSTAMQGVLSQNASFSATTTQVFQASKIEPIMEVPAGYVVLNNVDGTIMQQAGSQPNIISANVLQQPIPQIQSPQQVHSQVQPQQINTQQIQPIYNIQQHHPQQQSMMHQQPCLKLRAVSPVKPAMKATQISATKIQPQISSKLGPNRSITNNQSHVFQNLKSSPIIISKTVSITPAVDSNPIVMQTATTAVNNVPKILKSTPVSIAQQYPLKPKVNAMASNATLMPIQLVQRKMNMIRPLNKSSAVNIKPKICKQATSKINTQCKTTIQAPTLIAPKPQYFTQRNVQQNVAQQSSSSDTNLQPMQFNVSLVEPGLSQQIKTPIDFLSGVLTTEQTSFLKTTSLADVSATCNNSVYQQSNNFQYSVNCTVSSSQPINLPTSSSSIQLPSAPFISPYGNNIPTNIVNPIQQMATSQSSNIVSRPTNRVLPMQTIQQKFTSSTSTEQKDDEIKTHDKNLNSDNDLKNISKGQYMKLNILEKSQAEVNNFINPELELENESNIAVATDIMAINARDPKNEAYKEKILENETLLDNDFEIKASTDDKCEITTSEVKEKICKILENLDEECDKNPLMEENFGQNGLKIIDKVDQKENVDPTNLIEFCKTEATPIKYKTCSLSKPTGPRLLYEIQSEDGFTYKSTSITEIWEKVFEAVQVARKAHGLLPLPEGPLADMCGIQMLGLKTNALKYLIEQLPGVERCTKYTPKYNKNERKYNCEYLSDQEELKENHFGSTRCEPFSMRSDYDMFSWLASRHRKQPIQLVIQPSENELIPRRGTGSNLPMAMKYRTLKETYKNYVGVFRSHIHGRGLYCTKDIEAGEMVIEYAGELIRSTLTDKRERHYDSKGIGCYMFKIDDNLVVDATMRGNAARFINHSCEPNCYSKVVDILGHKHIIIFALRRIVQGEELTYDYKFPFEDIKIPCSCGSKKCRKYLN